LETAAVKRWIGEALEELKPLLQNPPVTRAASKCWTLFSSDFQAHNFKVVFETVCKWLGILLGGGSLLYFLFSQWTRKPTLRRRAQLKRQKNAICFTENGQRRVRIGCQEPFRGLSGR
jgi:hypothetical protein